MDFGSAALSTLICGCMSKLGHGETTSVPASRVTWAIAVNNSEPPAPMAMWFLGTCRYLTSSWTKASAAASGYNAGLTGLANDSWTAGIGSRKCSFDDTSYGTQPGTTAGCFPGW